MIRTGPALALAVALGVTLPGAASAQQGGRYGAWGGEERTQRLLDELRTLVEEAERARAADRRFLGDLRDLVRRYDRPWRDELLSEDFSSATRGAGLGRWEVLEGRFVIDRYDGLVAELASGARAAAPAGRGEPPPAGSSDPGRDLAMALLGSLLKQQGGASPAPATTPPASAAPAAPGRAAIRAPLAIPNAFAARLELRTLDPGAELEIGVSQRSGHGYRLALRSAPTGGQAAIELRRMSPRGYAVIGSSFAPPALADGAAHTLEWTRNPAGEMAVLLDGETVVEARDRSLRDPFTGLDIAEAAGRTGIRSISLWGAR